MSEELKGVEGKYETRILHTRTGRRLVGQWMKSPGFNLWAEGRFSVLLTTNEVKRLETILGEYLKSRRRKK